MSVQPNPLVKASGVKVSIGVLVNGDRMEITFPLSTDDGGLAADQLAADAVSSIVANVFPSLLACMSNEAVLTFCQAVGMNVGYVPFRQDYDPSAHPGTLAHPSNPSNVTGLIVYYADPADLNATQRMRVGKIFMPAVPAFYVLGDNLTATIVANYNTFGNLLLNGFNTQLGGGKWWRPLSDKTVIAFPNDLIRSDTMVVRGHVATQRRRMLPH